MFFIIVYIYYDVYNSFPMRMIPQMQGDVMIKELLNANASTRKGIGPALAVTGMIP